MVTINEYLCCDICLFPIIDCLNKQRQLTSRQQLYMFAFLSVCYWKESISNNNDNAKMFGDNNEKQIWIHRLKIAWETADAPFICYFAQSTVCLQCLTNNKNVIKQFSDINFNINYFCYNCLFPLFDTLVYV